MKRCSRCYSKPRNARWETDKLEDRPKNRQFQYSASIIVVNYNGQEWLPALFRSLESQSRSDFEVIMVDNASTDDSVEYVAREFPQVKLVRSQANVGFAQGNNLGVTHARGKYIVLLNSDTVAERDWLNELVRVIDSDDSIGAVVSKIYHGQSSETFDCAGARFNSIGFCWGRGARQKDMGQFDEIEEVPAGTACSMIVRREALNGEPLFDESFFMYYEEFELSLRIREAGYRIVYAPSSIVHHRRNQSVKKEHSQPSLFCQFHGNRNRVKILAKYYPAGVLLVNAPWILLSLAYWNLFFLRTGGLALLARAVAAQFRYLVMGLSERRSRRHAAKTWLPWMEKNSFRDLLDIKRQKAVDSRSPLETTNTRIPG